MTAAKVMRLPIDIRLNTVVTDDLVAEVKPDAIIACVGADPLGTAGTRSRRQDVVFGAQLEKNDPRVGHRVVVIGGGLIGCEEGIALAREGHEVTILEMQQELCPRLRKNAPAQRDAPDQVADTLSTATGMRCTGIDDQGSPPWTGTARSRNSPPTPWSCAPVCGPGPPRWSG